MNTSISFSLYVEKITRIICIIIIYITFSTSGYATTCTANSNGAWNSAGTWSCGHVPVCGDTIVIPASITVTNSNQQDYSACPSVMLVRINGILYFQHGFKLKLPCGSQIIISSGGEIQADVGGGNSNYIEICGNNMWNSGCGTIYGPLNMPPYDCSPLPVTLISFTADAVKNHSLLSWTTSSEINNDYFSIEKSKDAEHFSEMGKVAGSGNSTNTHNYSYADEYPNEGFSYYRLKQVDYDGAFEYSDVIAVKFDKDGLESLQAYVDYNNESIVLFINTDFTGKAIYRLSNMLGNNIVSGFIHANDNTNKVVISTKQLAKGVYLFSFINDTLHLTKKILY